ncbi:hypothetical protein CRG98_011894 [Punica granatum]|uniref:Aminotransferase-like plant mobile domain-containing protein n=2 Tax=Punica granatum TaxID=22663 RepID=A0A2I0KGT6_PUNGR|nr:hypothetical protein CRG98_011894 [Punica granatum]
MEALVRERREFMAPPFQEQDTKPILRAGHFLKPTATSYSDAQPPSPPPLSLSSSSPPPPPPPLKLDFPAWRNPPKCWKKWVELMEPEHSATWQRAGLFEAVKASAAAPVVKDPDLIIGMAQRWSPETNTFVFPWGEATITLEDVMLAGGYSVSGYPVAGRAETEEMVGIEMRLNQAWSELRKGKSKKASDSPWMKMFMSSGSEIEHEAFLALFVSRFVFPRSLNVICKSSLPIAVQLARGKRIALAPAVLADIYTDLSQLRNQIDSLAGGRIKVDRDIADAKLTLWAPFQLVQVWVWERFPKLRLNPNPFRKGEPTITQLVRLKSRNLDNVGMALDSSGRSFQWRPYSDHGSEEELKSSARCLIACGLEGSRKNIEWYHPHRAAMQFGLDQDLPSWVRPSSIEKPLGNVRMYVPSHLPKPGVTARYLSWWEESKSGSGNADHDAVKSERTSKSSKTSLWKCMEEKNLSAPPGFKRKWNEPDSGGSSNEEKLMVWELLRSRRKDKGVVRNENGPAIEGSGRAMEGSGYDQSKKRETIGEDDGKERRNLSAAEMQIKELRARVSKAEQDIKVLKLMCLQKARYTSHCHQAVQKRRFSD